MSQTDPNLALAAGNAARACAEAVERLVAAGIKPEGLADYVERRRVLLISRAATMRPLGEVWRVGTLLLSADGRLFRAGAATRARERGRPSYQSESREARREIAAAALRGGYHVGAAVNYDAQEIELTADGLATLGSDDPVGVAGGEVRVRWRAGASLDGAPTLAQYLTERVGLLIHPLT